MLRRVLAGFLAILASVGSAAAQTADLSEGPTEGVFFRVDLAMKLTGKTKVQQDGKTLDQPLAADAQHEFIEKVLQTSEGIVTKTVRTYRKAQANIRGTGRPSARTFRPDRTLLVTQRWQGQSVTYCPHGSLTREELELTEHFCTLGLTGLLPGKTVKVGDSWSPSKAVAQSLCALEGLLGQDLTCSLEDVKNGIATVRVKGTVTGIDLGVDVRIGVQAVYAFDIAAKRLTQLTWTQHDVREQGPACPALEADVEVTLRRSLCEQPPELGSVVLGGVLPPGAEPPADMTLISYSDRAGRFAIQYPREWMMTAQSADFAVWRLMNRGDLVAQVTLAPWTKREAGKMMTFDDFLSAIEHTVGWKEERVEEKNDKLQIEANRAYRYAAVGHLDRSEVVQYFYLLASPQGDHLFVTFTLSPTQVKTLNFRHERFLKAITFPGVAAGPAGGK